MRYIESPTRVDGTDRPFVFLAGGITGCEDWQKQVVDYLMGIKGLPGTIINPRREDFPVGDLEAISAQADWDNEGLWLSDLVSFWFDGGESEQPMAMFLLGCHLGRYIVGGGPTKIVVGADPNYKRILDVKEQTRTYSARLHAAHQVGIGSSTVLDHARNIARAICELKKISLPVP